MRSFSKLLGLVLAFSVSVANAQTLGPPGSSGSGGAPSGPAGGDLGGTYPNPTVLNLSHVTTGLSGFTQTFSSNFTTTGAGAITIAGPASPQNYILSPTGGPLGPGTAGIVSATPVALGTGYVPATYPQVPDVVTLAGGGASTNGAILVTATQVVSATVAAGGTGCTNGAQTVTGTTGGSGWATGTLFQASVTVSGNAITAVNSISRAGVYYKNPTAISAEPVTGASCVGAQLNVVMGALQGVVQTTGVYPSTQAGQIATLSQGSTSQAGTGATWSVTYAATPSLPIATGAFGGTIEGFGAGAANLADANTFYGFNAGAVNTFGRENTFIGNSAGAATTGGSGGSFPDNGQSTCIGSFACSSQTTGLKNVAVGQKAGNNNLTGGSNVYVGTHSGTSMLASNNVVVGSVAGDVATTSGGSHVLIGFSAGQYLQGAAAQDVYIGQFAGAGTSGNPSTASSNVGIGFQTLESITSGTQIAAIGYNIAPALTTQNGLAALGYQAGLALTTGNGNNTLIGNSAGKNLTTAKNMICLGSDSCDTAAVNSSNSFIAGSQASAGAERIDNVWFGRGQFATAPSGYAINGTGGSGTDIGGGDITIAGGGGTGAGGGGLVHLASAPASTTGTTINSLKDAALVDGNLHLRVGNGTAPALTSCGTGSPTIAGTDVAGLITMGTAAAGCTLTFNKAYANAPFCTVTWQGSPLALQSYAISATVITLTQTPTSGNLVNYMCVGQNGG